MLLTTIVFLITYACALNILLTSTGQWDTTNLRTLYDRLKDHSNHNVLLVAPLRASKSCEDPELKSSDGNISGSLLHDKTYMDRQEFDQDIWYVNDCATRTSLIALDYIIPTFYIDWSFDLIIVGPTEENNAGPLNHLLNSNFQLSKLLSFRQIPVISVHTNDPTARPHNLQDRLEDNDPAFIYSQKVTELVNGLCDYVRDAPFGTHDFQTTKSKFVDQNNVKFDEILNSHDQLDEQNTSPRILPPDVILNVNFPLVGSISRAKCVDPSFQKTCTRSRHQMMIPSATFEETNNSFKVEMATISMPTDPKGEDDQPNEALALESCAISVTAISNTGEDFDLDLSNILDPKYRIRKDLEALEKLKKSVTEGVLDQDNGLQPGDFYSGKLNALVEGLFK